MIVVQGSKHFTNKDDILKRPLPGIGGKAERPLQAETARVATLTISQMNTCFLRVENNVAAEFDERQRIYRHEFSVESAQALEAQREVLTHEAAEEIHRKDCVSLRMMRTLSQLSEKDLNRLWIIFRGL